MMAWEAANRSALLLNARDFLEWRSEHPDVVVHRQSSTSNI